MVAWGELNHLERLVGRRISVGRSYGGRSYHVELDHPERLVVMDHLERLVGRRVSVGRSYGGRSLSLSSARTV